MSSQIPRDKQTLNILILELATMVVAIALAFAANFLTTFDLPDLGYFVLATAIVIWFWWGYVMDRLAFPPKTMRFPLTDVFVLIFISLIPFALRQRQVWAISGTLAIVLIAWALMIDGIIKENADVLNETSRRKLRLESYQRLIVGVLLILDAVIDVVVPRVGFFLLFIPGVIAIMWTLIANLVARRKPLL